MGILTISEIVRATGGVLLSGKEDAIVSEITTDSRNTSNGALFVPLKGERFDGHEFIAMAFKNGALGCVTHSEVDMSYTVHENKCVIRVTDTLAALREIATYYRSKFPIPIVGITGSVGKTTTKDMIACVLEQKYTVLKTQGNFNNEIGVPLTIFNLENIHEIGVLEMGMSGLGEISRLVSIVKPQTAVITNIGLSHIENLGSKENILKAKMELFEQLNEDDFVILNGDDPLLFKLKGKINYKTMFFGINNPECDILAQNIIKDGDAGINFDIDIEKVRYTIKLSVMGEHNIYNALAAITIGLKYNVDIDDIIKGLFEFKSGNMRMDVFEANGVRVINDCYNASPASMEAGIKILKDTKSGNRKIAILGDMFELGEWSLSLHKEVGTFVANNDVDILITVGVNAANIGIGAIEAGMPKEKIMSFNSNSEAINFIKDFLKQLDIVLIKGSRGMKMEEISMFLRGVA